MILLIYVGLDADYLTADMLIFFTDSGSMTYKPILLNFHPPTKSYFTEKSKSQDINRDSSGSGPVLKAPKFSERPVF